MPVGAGVDRDRAGEEKGTCLEGRPPQGAGEEWQLSLAPTARLAPPVLYRH